MSKEVSLFWWYWLLVVISSVILFGLALLLLPEPMLTFFNWLCFGIFTPAGPFNPVALNYITFAHGVLGAVMVGWGVGLLIFVRSLWRRVEPVSWYGLASSILVWFVLDTSLSLLRGFVGNAVLNLVFLVAFAIPLVATYRRFTSSTSQEP